MQGIYSAYAVTPEDSGAVLIPGSHLITYDWERSNDKKLNFVPISREPNDQKMQMEWMEKTIKPHLPENSLLLFNSKVVHANAPADPERAKDFVAAGRLPRLAAAVAFAPRARRSEQIKQKKAEGFRQGKATNHWPCSYLLKKPPSRQRADPTLKQLVVQVSEKRLDLL